MIAGGYVTVAAEDVPLGVPVWHTRRPEYADRFTVESVAVIRDETYGCGWVEWTYRSGDTRTFSLGEEVFVKLPTDTGTGFRGEGVNVQG